MAVISINEFKAKKAAQIKALQYAKEYNVSIKDVLATMEEVVTVTPTISRSKVMDALAELGIDELDNDIDVSDIEVIQWNPDIPY